MGTEVHATTRNIYIVHKFNGNNTNKFVQAELKNSQLYECTSQIGGVVKWNIQMNANENCQRVIETECIYFSTAYVNQ